MSRFRQKTPRRVTTSATRGATGRAVGGAAGRAVGGAAGRVPDVSDGVEGIKGGGRRLGGVGNGVGGRGYARPDGAGRPPPARRGGRGGHGGGRRGQHGAARVLPQARVRLKTATRKRSVSFR